MESSRAQRYLSILGQALAREEPRQHRSGTGVRCHVLPGKSGSPILKQLPRQVGRSTLISDRHEPHCIADSSYLSEKRSSLSTGSTKTINLSIRAGVGRYHFQISTVRKRWSLDEATRIKRWNHSRGDTAWPARCASELSWYVDLLTVQGQLLTKGISSRSSPCPYSTGGGSPLENPVLSILVVKC